MRLRIEIDDTDITQQLRDIANFIDVSFPNEEDAIPFIAWVEHQGCDFEDKWIREFREAYLGKFRNEYHFAQHHYENTVGKPNAIVENYMGWTKFGDSLFEDDFIKIDADNGIYAFRRL